VSHDDRVGPEIAVDDAGPVSIGQGVGYLDRELDSPPGIDRSPLDLLFERDPRGEFVREITVSLASPASNNVAMFGCDNAMAARALSKNDSRLPGSRNMFAETSFNATVRPTLVSRARHTSPVAPSPICSRTL
jgi:hypothetical protein